MSGERSLHRLTPNAKQGRIQAGKIAVESTLISNEATKRRTGKGRRGLVHLSGGPLHQRLSSGLDVGSQRIVGGNEQEKNNDRTGARSGSATPQPMVGGTGIAPTEVQRRQEEALEEFAKSKGVGHSMTGTWGNNAFLFDQNKEAVGC
jgi:hypothetical protein